MVKPKIMKFEIKSGYAQIPVSNLFINVGDLIPSIEPKINAGKITVVNIIITSEIVTRKTIQEMIPVL